MPRRTFNKDDDFLNLMPFINFLVVLIPVLMLSAEFAAVNIIAAKLPADTGSRTDTLSLSRPPVERLFICVSDSSLFIAADDRLLWTRNIAGAGFPAEELDAALGELRRNTDPSMDRIILASCAEVKYQRLIDIMDFARKNGFGDVSLARWRG